MLTEVDVTKFASYRWGKRDGIAEGELKKAQDMARQLLTLGVIPEEEIARIAGLTLEQVAALRKQH